jgi:bacillolysin
MKNNLLLVIFSLAITFSSAQNAFDKRSVRTPSNGQPVPGVSGITDGSKVRTQNTYAPALDISGARKEVDIRRKEAKRTIIANPLQASDMAYSFLKAVSKEINNTFNPDQMKIFESTIDAQGISHVKFQQVCQGIDVYGSEIFVHMNGEETYTHGSWYDISPDFDAIPKITRDAASALSVKAIHPEMGFKALTATEKKLLNYEQPESILVIILVQGSPVLCYDITVRPNMIERWKVRINAKTGEVIESYNYTCHVDGPRTGNSTDLNGVSRTVNSYQVGTGFYLIDATKSMFSLGTSSLPDDPKGAIWTIDAGNTPGQSFNNISSGSSAFSNPKGVSAHYNAGFAYEYYKNTFNRNSINGSGGTIISVINVSDESGQGLDNAYWNGSFMAYGNGKTTFKPLAGSLDVAGHEMTHGVVEKSANLEYKQQSGAINESMADIFGCMMDRDDWNMGEDVMKAGGALRNMQDPHNGGSSVGDGFFQPKHMSEYYSGEQDNGGVHINSGIPNHAFYRFATALGKDKAEQVYYKALTVYLTKTSVFKDLRKAVIQAATDLYGSSAATEAGSAFDAVGIYGDPVGGGGGTIGNNVADLPVNPGQDFLLYYDLDPNVSTTITKGTISSGITSGQVTRVIKHKPSVMDDGSFCVYVGSDSRIYSLRLDGSKTEGLLSNENIWENVAISKDGKRLAAITKAKDTSIYVYDFGKTQWHQFKLYNPTYSGVNSGGVLYADALEWDHTGTRIMYDAQNIINNNGGSDYTYWDVGILQVWDLEANTWGDGKIEKLFSSLPDNVSIGNPVFSQRSPYIVAFDYIDGASNQYFVVGYNLNTNKTGTIFSGSNLGFPCFSRNDGILIFNAFNTSGDEIIAQSALASDKINKSGNPSVLVGLAQWGVWYANGTRPLLFSSKEITSFAFQGLAPAVTAVISGTTITCTVPANTDLSSLVASFTNSPYSYVRKGSIVQTSGVNSNDFTTTQVYTVVAQDGTTKNYTVKVTKETVSIDDLVKDQVLFYPNPAVSDISISYVQPIESVSIYHISGQLLITYAIGREHAVIDIRDLENGLYIALVKTAEGSAAYRFIKQDE